MEVVLTTTLSGTRNSLSRVRAEIGVGFRLPCGEPMNLPFAPQTATLCGPAYNSTLDRAGGAQSLAAAGQRER